MNTESISTICRKFADSPTWDAVRKALIEAADEIERLKAELSGEIDACRTNPETIRGAVEAERNRMIKAAIVKDFGSNPYYVALGRNSICNIPTEELAVNEVRRILGLAPWNREG